MSALTSPPDSLVDAVPADRAVRGLGAKARVNSFDVARLAGVSQSAVSRSFTAGASVSPQMRGKVLEAARLLGYRPMRNSSSQDMLPSRLVALVVPGLHGLLDPLTLDALTQRLQDEGLQALLFVRDVVDSEAFVRELLLHGVGGVLLCGDAPSAALARRCADAGMAVVLFDRSESPSLAGLCSAVRSDDALGGRELGRHLVRAGCRRIAVLGSAPLRATHDAREGGLRQALAEVGLEVVARAAVGPDTDLVRAATRELFDAPCERRPDALFACDDRLAITAMDTLRRDLGLEVPRDVAVVGFDNVPPSAWHAYALTTWEQPVASMADAAAELMTGALRERRVPRREIVVPGRLIVRRSVLPPKD